MYIIGFSFGYHDSSVAVFRNGELVGLYYEERFSRCKHDKNFPKHALTYVVTKYGLCPENILGACYYEDPALKFKRIYDQFEEKILFYKFLSAKSDKGLLINPINLISKKLRIPINNVKYIEHHTAHFHTSRMLISQNEALEGFSSMNIDGVGEKDTVTSVMSGAPGDPTQENKKTVSEMPHSLGLFYSAITAYLGFNVNDAEYRVMGLAAYGKPEYVEAFQELAYVDKSKKFKLDTDYFDFSPGALFPFTPKFIEKFGPPAPPSDHYASTLPSDLDLGSNRELQRYANIASSAQQCLTQSILKLIEWHSRNTETPLLYSGGVALNSKSNYEIWKKYDLRIPADPGDGGSSIGAGAALVHHTYGAYPVLSTPYLGFNVQDEDIESILKDRALTYIKSSSAHELVAIASELLAQRKIIGWAQGRSEFGPRALGNRSILANPSDIEVRDHINKAVKFRETFRPFAPAICRDDLEELFHTRQSKIISDNDPLYFMLVTLPAKDKAKKLLPACVHIDNTSRVQIVSEKSNPLFYDLIQEFKRKTGIPALLNTSFNVKGEPIVDNTEDVINTFRKTALDVVCVDNFIVRR